MKSLGSCIASPKGTVLYSLIYEEPLKFLEVKTVERYMPIRPIVKCQYF